jgi:hypothetical protein
VSVPGYSKLNNETVYSYYARYSLNLAAIAYRYRPTLRATPTFTHKCPAKVLEFSGEIEAEFSGESKPLNLAQVAKIPGYVLLVLIPHSYRTVLYNNSIGVKWGETLVCGLG